MYNNRKAFTLIELLVVVLIIGILAAIALPQYTRAMERARSVDALTTLKAITNAEDMYILTYGAVTDSFDKLDVSIPGTKVNDSTIKGTNFTFDIRLYSTPLTFEIVATREGAVANSIRDYYIYRAHDNSYICVARSEKARSICTGISGKVQCSLNGGSCYYGL